jgi:hypothetical protein
MVIRGSLMALYAKAPALIRENLEQIKMGKRVGLVAIGELTTRQLEDINRRRVNQGLTPITAEVVFIGRHICQSRIVNDGYTIDDVIDQISSALCPESVVLDIRRITAMERMEPREDHYGNNVRDRAIFECTSRHPAQNSFR